MPGTRAGHAVTSLQPAQPSEMEPSRGRPRLLEEAAPQSTTGSLFHTDDTIAGPDVHGHRDNKTPIDKKSLDYILRTGVAGGLAGCAVRCSTLRQ